MATRTHSTVDIPRNARLATAYHDLESTFDDLAALGTIAQSYFGLVMDQREAKGTDRTIVTMSRQTENALVYIVNRLAEDLRQAREAYHAGFETPKAA